MTLFNTKAVSATFPDQVASGPPTSFVENVKSAFKATEATELLVSEDRLVNEAIRERRQTIEEITGKPFDESISAYMPDPNSELGIMFAEHDEEPIFGRHLETLAENEAIQRLRDDLPPDKAGRILSNKQLSLRAREMAIDRVQANEDIYSRGSGVGAIAGQFLGGVGAQFTDPLILLTLPIGPASGARVAVAAAINGAIAGGVTAAQQPVVQKWRKELGLPSGIDVALSNIATAAIGGAGITAGAGAIAKSIKFSIDKFSPRQQIQAFDDFVPDPTPAQQVARSQLEAEVRFAEENPITPKEDTIKANGIANAEHSKRAGMVARAMENEEPLPLFDEAPEDVISPQPLVDRLDEVQKRSDPVSPEVKSESDALIQRFRQQIDDDGDFEIMLDDGEELVPASRVLDDFDNENSFLREVEACR